MPRESKSPSRTMRLQEWKNDASGGIEGLPLQLMIVILVATMGTAIIVGWMGSIETPKAIGDVSISEVVATMGEDGSIEDVIVTVYDQDGNPLEGAIVTLSGYGIKDGGGDNYEITKPNGTATFQGLSVSYSGNLDLITIEVHVTKSGYADSGTYEFAVAIP